MGLRLNLQPRPLCHGYYAISARRPRTLPAASFRFHLNVDILAVRLTLSITKCVVDFHHQAIAHGRRTNKTTIGISVGRSCRWLCALSEFLLNFGAVAVRRFSHRQSDFPYTIFTPFRRGVVWNYMKLCSVYLCGKSAGIKDYRYLWSNIEI